MVTKIENHLFLMSLAEQINFTSKSGCKQWTPNLFKKEKCGACCFVFSDHDPQYLNDEHISDYLHHLNSKNPCNEVLPSSEGYGALYLGSFQALSDANLKKYRITKGVQTAKNLEGFFVAWGNKLKEAESRGEVQLLRLNWVDGNEQTLWLHNKWDQLQEAIEFIHEHRKNGENVLVNCAQGKSRSSSVVVAYLMCVNNLSFSEALKFTQSKRAIAEPNHSFQTQLQEFENSDTLLSLRSKLT